MNVMTRISVAAVTAALLTTAAMAQSQPPMDHSKHGQAAPKAAMPAAPAAAKGGDNVSTKAFKAANDKMHADMDQQFTGNADVDFLKGMIPHHQGAIDMAKVVLGHGKDPKARKLAQDIIKAQEREIAMMKSWLAQKKQ